MNGLRLRFFQLKQTLTEPLTGSSFLAGHGIFSIVDKILAEQGIIIKKEKTEFVNFHTKIHSLFRIYRRSIVIAQ